MNAQACLDHSWTEQLVPVQLPYWPCNADLQCLGKPSLISAGCSVWTMRSMEISIRLDCTYLRLDCTDQTCNPSIQAQVPYWLFDANLQVLGEHRSIPVPDDRSIRKPIRVVLTTPQFAPVQVPYWLFDANLQRLGEHSSVAKSYRLLSPHCYQGLFLKIRPAYGNQDMAALVRVAWLLASLAGLDCLLVDYALAVDMWH